MNARKVFISTLMVIGLMAGGAYAQTLDGKKVAYLDLSRIFDNYTKTKEYDAVLEKDSVTYETERNKKVEVLKEKQSKSALLKEDEKAKLEKEIEDGKASLLEYDRQQQTELRKKRDEKIREILLEVEKIVKNYAEKEGYALILNDRVLIYGDKSMDITEKILQLLNESYPVKK